MEIQWCRCGGLMFEMELEQKFYFFGIVMESEI